MLEPYLQDADVQIFCGDALDVLREMPDASVHMCATSPPFYGLRDYGVEGQIGLEDSPDAWVARLVEVFREVRRVLRDDGTLWVEIGDSYASSQASDNRTSEERSKSSTLGPKRDGLGGQNAAHVAVSFEPRKLNSGVKPKDLIGQPWLLAFALRADGWYLRSEIIWARPNPMPESVTDRPTKAHSTVFLLSKKPRYYMDMEAIREALIYPEQLHQSAGVSRVTDARGQSARETGRTDGFTRPLRNAGNPAGANARSVWQIATEPTPFAHFATWPQKLVQRMILAGTSDRGVCPECGAPRVRVTETSRQEQDVERIRNVGGRTDGFTRTKASGGLRPVEVSTLGWRPSCSHEADPIPATVLDIFGGSGTTAIVARKLGRRAILIELNESYAALAADRLSQQSLFAEASA